MYHKAALKHGVLLAALGASASAGAVQINDKLSVGAGLRTSFTSVENGAPDGDSRSNDFNLDSIRLYINGQITDQIGVTFNTDYDDVDEKVKVLDAIARFEYSDTVNFWAGRFLPPSDRSNLSGPYYLTTWNFPSVQAYPAIFAGRDDGVAYWGQYQGGQVKWQFSVTEGPDDPVPADDDDDLLFSGRLTFNFLDPEPGYYNASTYYGEKDILALGLVTQQQGSDNAYSVDALFEKNLGVGTVTVEGAYYKYDGLGGLADPIDPTLDESEGYFALIGYLFPQEIGPGRFQPVVRYTKGEVTDGAEGDIKEFNLNYIMLGHNARISAAWQQRDDELFTDNNTFVLGLQLQM
ncbi:hypothetical protein [Alloalcanivorax mobilis]|uniref:hypothetical protein n=1 Tax=Alloalcanivorax mobilis TaxID=2019569 RepID=UPI000B5B29A4|nr:hypothetical protein [Alloalcanivorax mobilis]ASK32897.1 hypothetical protein CEK62_00130 [Alcanivorax sp. N3-2A]ASK36715.1 hypothetical protein CEK62_20320 [Alcanivorax sp. N3-2A]